MRVFGISSGLLFALGTLSFAIVACQHDIAGPVKRSFSRQAIEPVHATFGKSQFIFPSEPTPQLEHLASTVESSEFPGSLALSLHPNTVTLDTSFLGPDGETWCHSLSSEMFTDTFRVRDRIPTAVQLRQIRSQEQLLEMPGRPDSPSGQIGDGSVRWGWNICNGKAGKAFEAAQITAVLYRLRASDTDTSPKWDVGFFTLRRNALE